MYRDIEVPLFRLSEIFKAIDNFSVENKPGEAVLGPVYKVYTKRHYALTPYGNSTMNDGCSDFE